MGVGVVGMVGCAGGACGRRGWCGVVCMACTCAYTFPWLFPAFDWARGLPPALPTLRPHAPHPRMHHTHACTAPTHARTHARTTPTCRLMASRDCILEGLGWWWGVCVSPSPALR